jgi:hypothetical protein
MASIKNLKKDIDYVLGDIMDECEFRELSNPDADVQASEAIKQDIFDVFDELTAKIHTKDVDNKKAHFGAIRAELHAKASELLNRVNKL